MKLFAETALLPSGWQRDVLFEIGPQGDLTAVSSGADPAGAERLAGPAVPGMPNLHSHAFQRALAGLGERAGERAGERTGELAGGAGAAEDSFWTWRQVMYAFLEKLGPDEIEAVAAQLYVEMLKAGYTAVAEFHYLHHGPDGQPYDDLAETSRRIVAAARRTGIGLTLLPVLYRYGDFGAAEPTAGQRRFLNGPERFLRLHESLAPEFVADPQLRLGLAPHSLRAVSADIMRKVLETLRVQEASLPVHIHIAEQTKEVRDCIAWSGLRPVEWLLESFEIDPRWCLIHATHVTEEETRRLAESGAVAGLCPTTEANLGDGVFPAPAYLAAGGRWGIGSDSHISVSPVEELRWLEYGQRLTLRRRNVLRGSEASVGASLYKQALEGGAQALGRPLGRLAPGCRADLVVLDAEQPNLIGKSDDLLLDALVFAGNGNAVRDVMVGGRWCIVKGRHPAEPEVLRAYRSIVASAGD